MPRFDASKVVGELESGSDFYGLPGKLELEREYLAQRFHHHIRKLFSHFCSQFCIARQSRWFQF